MSCVTAPYLIFEELSIWLDSLRLMQSHNRNMGHPVHGIIIPDLKAKLIYPQGEDMDGVKHRCAPTWPRFASPAGKLVSPSGSWSASCIATH